MRHGEVELKFADGAYLFRLAIGQLRELQEKTGAGPLALLRRLHDGTWLVDDCRETIRLGLIGGGLDPRKALGLVERYVDERPVMEASILAQAVLMPVLFQSEEDRPLGEAGGEGSKMPL